MKDLTVIIPLHGYNKNVEALLTTAVESLKNADKNEECNTIIVSPLESIKLPDFGLKNLKIVKSEKGDFCTQINTAVNECKTKYFSILEYDDENDALAIKQLQSIFPDKEVVGVRTKEIVYGGGNIHCITQQEPLVKK